MGMAGFEPTSVRALNHIDEFLLATFVLIPIMKKKNYFLSALIIAVAGWKLNRLNFPARPQAHAAGPENE